MTETHADWSEDLAAQHRYYLQTRAVSPEVAAARGYVTANSKTTMEELGFGVAQRRVPALIVPVWAPWPSDDPAVYQARPDFPRRTAEGKALKFEYPSKATMHLDVHPRVRDVAGDHRVPLVITEGIIKADAGVSRLGVCVVGIAGVWCWRGTNDDGGKTVLADWEHVALNDREIIVVFDSDVMLKRSVHDALVRLGALLHRRGAPGLHYAYLPSGERGKPVGLDDWLAQRPDETPDRLIRDLAGLCQDRPMGEARPVAVVYEPPERRSLADVDAVFDKWLAKPDHEALRAILAAVVANRAPGDPVWLLPIAPPSSGKTEHLMALDALPDVIVTGRLTTAALMSGTSDKERSSDATGGLLRQVGDQGILVNKDFGTVLSMPREPRAEVLQALRDIFDGYYDRAVGVDGGRHLVWRGRCGFIAGCTEAIDTHYAVIAALGDRFIFIRLELADAEAQADQAMRDDDDIFMRQEMSEAVAGLLGHAPNVLPALDPDVRRRLALYSALAVRCRSVVDRDPYSREIVSVPRAEQPARFAKELAKLYRGLLVIGCDLAEAWRIVVRIVLDSMPAGRRKVLDQLADTCRTFSTTEIGMGIGLPSTATRRHLEDLEAHGVVVRHPGGSGKADLWELSEWCRQRWPTFPDLSPPMGKENEVVDDDTSHIGVPKDPDTSGTVAREKPWTEEVAVKELIGAFPGAEVEAGLPLAATS